MSADWWKESRRGQVMGYGIRWGNHWAHITEVKDSGPGANNIRALCGGVQGLVHINSGLDLDNQAKCEDWKHLDIRFPLNCAVELVFTNPRRLSLVCPKCKAKYEKRTQPAAKESECTTAQHADTITAGTGNG